MDTRTAQVITTELNTKRAEIRGPLRRVAYLTACAPSQAPAVVYYYFNILVRTRPNIYILS